MGLWYTYCEGFKIVNFIHDEVIAELPMDANLQNNVARLCYLIEQGMQSVTPDVLIRTDVALMDRWYKKADAVYDDQGNLILWHPKVAAVA